MILNIDSPSKHATFRPDHVPAIAVIVRPPLNGGGDSFLFLLPSYLRADESTADAPVRSVGLPGGIGDDGPSGSIFARTRRRLAQPQYSRLADQSAAMSPTGASSYSSI